MNQTYAFVIPRYGRGIAGGAETLVGSLAQMLARRGDTIEILTTCAKDNRTWENAFPAGTSIEDGVVVRRFPIDERNVDKWIPLQIKLSQGNALTVEEELEWMAESVSSIGLYDHIARHHEKYRFLFFAPYLFGTTFWGSLIKPKKSVLIPCLHDESYAYTSVIAQMFRETRGCLFNAAAEKTLAERLYGEIQGGEVGMGFDPISPEKVEALAPFFDKSFRYLIYVGRKETGKNVQVLVDRFIGFKDQYRDTFSDLKLVVVGGGDFADVERPEALLRDDVIDLAHVSEEEKFRLMKHSIALCQPSTNESFSIVLMESWLLGTPALVHSHCSVTRDHVVKSGGGLYFANQADFNGTVSELLTNDSLRKTMGQLGDDYVRYYYSWSAVLKRFDEVVESLSENKIEALLVHPGSVILKV